MVYMGIDVVHESADIVNIRANFVQDIDDRAQTSIDTTTNGVE